MGRPCWARGRVGGASVGRIIRRGCGDVVGTVEEASVGVGEGWKR